MTSRPPGQTRHTVSEMPGDAEDAAAQLAAPVMVRLHRVTVVGVVPAADDE